MKRSIARIILWGLLAVVTSIIGYLVVTNCGWTAVVIIAGVCIVVGVFVWSYATLMEEE